MAELPRKRILILTQIPVIMAKERRKLWVKQIAFLYKYYFFQGLGSIKAPIANH